MVYQWYATGRQKCLSARYTICIVIGLPLTDLFIDDGQSYLEEPPETPAPLFAVRAFKTAIFGTPHPNQDDQFINDKRLVQSYAVKATESVSQHQPPHENPATPGLSTEVNRKPNLEPLASPTKGILLTPGTAATRKKTVSFGGLANSTVSEVKLALDEIKSRDATSSHDQMLLAPTTSRAEPKNQSSLTKALFKAQLEASNKKPNAEADQQTNTTITVLSVQKKDQSAVGTTRQEETSEPAADTTVDLSQPRSRSGQHWKAEYELYHKNSAREMKKIIKYGQNVKSYALKKDSEATSLGKKLEHELSKVAAMETKVSKLATQLAKARQSGPDGDADQIKLMSDLAKHTALAVRHNQKAQLYRKSIEINDAVGPHDPGQNESYVEHEGKDLSPTHPSMKRELDEPPSDLLSLRTELETFKENVKSTEERAAKLEAENLTLKKSLARVKEEMDSYEKRRLSREQRLKNRELRLQQEKQEYERKLAEATREYKKLLHRADQGCKEADAAHPLSTQDSNDSAAVTHAEGGLREEGIFPQERGRSDAGHMDSVLTSPKRQRDQDSASPKSRVVRERPVSPPLRDTVIALFDDVKNKTPKLPKHDHKQIIQTSDMDIWMVGSPGDAVFDTSLSKGLTQSSHFGVLCKETNNALQEIDENSVLDPPANNQSSIHHSEKCSDKANSSQTPPEMESSVLPTVHSFELSMSSAVRRMHVRRLNISSPRPSMINFASSPPQQAFTKASIRPAHTLDEKSYIVTGSREQRYPSIVSSSTRTSTMTSAKRQSILPADRAAAARARLQKRSMEKQKLREKTKANAGL